VENSLRSVLPDSDIVVHVEPRDETLLADRVLAATLRIPGVHEAHNVTIFELAGRREVSLHLKVPGDLKLAEGHRIADQVAQAILLHVPEIKAAHTHLEPLDAYVDAEDLKEGELHVGVEQIVRAATGTPPRELRFVASDRGVVCFLTVALEPGMTVSQAHRVASQIESSIHREIPQIADVVAHIEP
jgi:divalent metal cation (Fe/Co/Zn/Cd) transporter